MSTLNIKDPEVYRLAAELAQLRGTSMTAVIRTSLREALDAEAGKRDGWLDRMREIAREVREIEGPWLTDDDMYDEMGLPK